MPVEPSRPAATAEPATSANSGAPSTNRERFVRACHCMPVDHPPIWLMRQAGRALPEYRALKEKYSFLQMVQTPELTTEVTLQPVRRFDFDAAILFSDILVINEGLGQAYRFGEKSGGGIQMDFLVNSAADLNRLQPEAVLEKLQYVAKALPMIKSALGGRTALIGFSGSPWTLANFMVEGGGIRDYTKAKAMFYSDPALFTRLMQILTKAVTDYLQMQIDAGVDAIQIFDSLAGALSDGSFAQASGVWIKQIIASLKRRVPVIVFARGAYGNWTELANIGAQVLGVDWNIRLSDVAARLPANVGVQGNLDPFLLNTTPEIVATETRRILSEMRRRPGHIFNLGHGVPPGAKLENIDSLVTAVRSYK